MRLTVAVRPAISSTPWGTLEELARIAGYSLNVSKGWLVAPPWNTSRIGVC
ncbi:hypothetical protein [Serratia marcescens]|uniref:hypothetical protein n=1 Tax=Serratia marcescens TaxID=615 RepID=UPI001F11B6B5|nr:hypothetical protein [Serratia marcescens]